MPVFVNNSQASLAVDEDRLAAAVTAVVHDAGYRCGEVSVAIVDDAQIHRINRQFLDHDYPTDVLSFPLGESEGRLEGEIVISADTAAANAAELGCRPHEELLLYAVHGALHLVGYRDKTDEEVARMRAAEGEYVRRFAAPPAAGATGGERSSGGDTQA